MNAKGRHFVTELGQANSKQEEKTYRSEGEKISKSRKGEIAIRTIKNAQTIFFFLPRWGADVGGPRFFSPSGDTARDTHVELGAADSGRTVRKPKAGVG